MQQYKHDNADGDNEDVEMRDECEDYSKESGECSEVADDNNAVI